MSEQDIVERPDPRCPCCGAAEPDWNGHYADDGYVRRDEEFDALRARVAALEEGLRECITDDAERYAHLVELMIYEAPWNGHQMVRGALTLAARAIRRGRHLTAAEKMANLKTAIGMTDCHPAPEEGE